MGEDIRCFLTSLCLPFVSRSVARFPHAQPDRGVKGRSRRQLPVGLGSGAGSAGFLPLRQAGR